MPKPIPPPAAMPIRMRATGGRGGSLPSRRRFERSHRRLARLESCKALLSIDAPRRAPLASGRIPLDHWSGMRHVWTKALALVTVSLGLLYAPAASEATFPGRNGLIAYVVACCDGSDTTEYETKLVAADGTRSRSIGIQASRVAFSPDGARLLWGDDYGGGLFVRRADGRGQVRRISRADAYSAAWSPNGKSIVSVRYGVFSGRPRLWVRKRGRGKPLTAGDNPSWSVRGEIAFEDLTGGISVIGADGSNLRSVVLSAAHPDWSPDGRQLAYTVAGAVWTVRADGTDRRRLHAGYSPCFSPDGHKIAYIDDGLKIMGAGGKHSHRLSFHGGSPAWQPLPR
jgi:hypothetical protein